MYSAQSAGDDPRSAPAPAPGGVYGHSSRAGVRRLGAGIGIAVLLLVLGLLAKTGPLTSLDTSINRAVSGVRNPLFTALAELLTFVMEPEAWAVLGVLGAVALFIAKRRGQALRVFCVMIGSIGVTFVVKALVHEHRPPKSLWVVPPDSEGSFPSGHTTAAAAVAVCVFLLVPVARRQLFAILGAAFVAVVALARVYLGVHYILDTAGAVLATACAVVFLSGLAALPPGRRWLLALDGSAPRVPAREERPLGYDAEASFFGDPVDEPPARHGTPPREDGYRPVPSREDGYRSASPREDGYRSAPPGEDGYRPVPSREDGYRSASPRDDGYRSAPPREDRYAAAPEEDRYREPRHGAGDDRGMRGEGRHGYQEPPAGGAVYGRPARRRDADDRG